MEKEGLGLGFVDRVRRTIDGRAKAVKQTLKDTKETVKAQKPISAGSIVSNQINNMRKANQELAPGIKELMS